VGKSFPWFVLVLEGSEDEKEDEDDYQMRDNHPIRLSARKPTYYDINEKYATP